MTADFRRMQAVIEGFEAEIGKNSEFSCLIWCSGGVDGDLKAEKSPHLSTNLCYIQA